MNKYLLQVQYTSDGMKGLMKEGGSNRRAYIERLITEAGGTLESFYYGLGGVGAYLILDLPDNATAAALNYTVNSSGSVMINMTPLLTPEEVDNAGKKKIGYRAPGQ